MFLPVNFLFFFQFSEAEIPLIAAVKCTHIGKAAKGGDFVQGLVLILGVIPHLHGPLDPDIVDIQAQIHIQSLADLLA